MTTDTPLRKPLPHTERRGLPCGGPIRMVTSLSWKGRMGSPSRPDPRRTRRSGMLAAMATDAPAATLVIGPEQFLAERAVTRILKSARAHDVDTERRDLDLSDEGAAGDFVEAISPTLFGGGIVVVATGVESAEPAVVDAVVHAIESPDEGVQLVFVHPGGVKGKAILERLRAAGVGEVSAERIKGRGVDDFVVAEFRAHGRAVTNPAVTALRAAVGDDLRALASAASQLSSDLPDDPIGDEQVGAYYEGVAGASGFAVSDAVWNADPTRVLVTLRWALTADPGFGPAIVATVAGALRSLLRLAGAPAGMGQPELAREVGVPAWKLTSLRSQLRRWTPRELADAARLLAAADVALKGGDDGPALDPVQKRALLERSLLDIATRPRPSE